MNFQIFLGFIVVCYLCYYFGTVAYDLLTGRKRAASEDEKGTYPRAYHSPYCQEAKGSCHETEADGRAPDDRRH